MSKDQLSAIFEATGVIKKGHFLRLSGRHADTFVQCARLFERAETARAVGEALAAACKSMQADLVLSAAIGGVLLGHETARALGLPHIYCEKREGALVLRRGFSIKKDARVLIVEDEVYTGQSVMEMQEIVRALSGQVAGIACVVDKSGGNLPIKVPFYALRTIQMQTYAKEACPMCQSGLPLENAG